MILGMTGATRDGMTDLQKEQCEAGMRYLNITEHHHGDCVGADEDSHNIALSLGLTIYIHPPEDDKLRAFCNSQFIMEEKGYFERNRDIVNDSEVVFGFPRGMSETGGGTWYTINYAKKQGKPLYVIYPDGTKQRFNVTPGRSNL